MKVKVKERLMRFLYAFGCRLSFVFAEYLADTPFFKTFFRSLCGRVCSSPNSADGSSSRENSLFPENCGAK